MLALFSTMGDQSKNNRVGLRGSGINMLASDRRDPLSSVFFVFVGVASEDAGPTLCKCHTNVLCLLDRFMTRFYGFISWCFKLFKDIGVGNNQYITAKRAER